MHAAGSPQIEWTALLLGAALAALAVAGWQVQGGTETPPAEVTFVTDPAQDLAVTALPGSSDTGTLRASEPGDGLEQRTTVQNATAAPLLVRLRATPATSDLETALQLRVTAKGESLFEGPLGGLREATSRGFRLAAHESAEVALVSWISPAAEEEVWRGRAQTVRLTYVTESDPR